LCNRTLQSSLRDTTRYIAELLTLSALRVAWRHRFSGAGLVLGAPAFFGGSLFLTTCLLIVSGQARGDIREMLLGKARAAA
jgi:hypothetical protein